MYYICLLSITVIAASSGNTGAALAVIGTQMGFNVTIITNKKCSQEKCNYITDNGANLWLAEDLPTKFPDILTNVKCYMEQERVIAENYPDEYFSVSQYNNLDNMMAHYKTTAEEIWDQSNQKVTHFVMAASTGGTIMGVGKKLKEMNENIKVILSDPHKSTLAGMLICARGQVQEGNAILESVKEAIKLEGGIQVEGAGKEGLTELMIHEGEVLKYVDEAIRVHDFDAFDACRQFERDNNGLRIGGSAGLNICACRILAEKLVDEGKGATMVTLLCDDGNKYASKIFNDEWMKSNDTRDKMKEEIKQDTTTSIGYRLDPENWETYRDEMHKLLNSCVEHMKAYRTKSWIPPTSELANKVKLDASKGTGEPLQQVMESLVSDIMPYSTGNTNPRFFGWVHGAGLPSSIAADLAAATMNSNCGGRNQLAADIEKSCISYLTQVAGFSVETDSDDDEEETIPFGVLTGGTSQATIYALMAARTRKAGISIRKTGIIGMGRVAIYISDSAHSCIDRAMECIGHGSDSVVRIPTTNNGSMDIDLLRKQLKQDKEEGIIPLAIVGTAGSVSIGAYDDFNAIADLAKEYNTWFHVDAAFGFWSRLSKDPRIKALTSSINRADSIALDAHKWPGVNYECGALLVRDKKHLRDTMAMRPSYLKSSSSGLAGGDTWFTDYSLDLSRGFRALKLWTALKTAGSDDIGQVVTDHCHLASYMSRLVNESSLLEMAHHPESNIACFSIKAKGMTAAEVATDLQLRGKGVFSTIFINGRDCLRAALVNHRTTESDIAEVIANVEEAIVRRR